MMLYSTVNSVKNGRLFNLGSLILLVSIELLFIVFVSFLVNSTEEAVVYL